MRDRVDEVIDIEVRDWLHVAVHGRAGQPCPRCGDLIGEVKCQMLQEDFAYRPIKCTIVSQSSALTLPTTTKRHSVWRP